MAHTDSEIILSENQEIIQSGTDEFGNMVYYVMDKAPDKSGLQGTADLIYNIVDQQGLCDQLSTSTGLDTDSHLLPSPSASVSLDSEGTVYQYTVPVSSVGNYQLPYGQGTNNNLMADKVRVEMVNSANNLNQVMSGDILDNSTTADIILASSEQPDITDSPTTQVHSYPSQHCSSVMSMSFMPPNVSNDNQTLAIPSNMEAAQILSNFSAETLESLQSLLDVEEDTTISTTTEELMDPAFQPHHQNYNNSLQTNNEKAMSLKMTQHKSRNTSLRESESHGDTKRSKQKTGRKMESDLLEDEYMSQNEVNIVKKSVSNYCPDFASYPAVCQCKCERGTTIPVEQIWLHKNQMYYLPQINILVISYEEYVGFLRQDKWYVSVGEITQRLIPNFRHEVESYLVKNVCDKQFLSLEEIEYLKQRKCVHQSMKSGTMISLDTLRVMCKYLASTKAFIQAPTTGLSNAAHGIIYRKIFEQHSRCSKCGGSVKDIEAPDKYVSLDTPVCDVQYSKIERASLSSGISLQKSMYVGQVIIGNVSFQSFKLDELTYISLKEIVEHSVFNLQVLQSRLVQLQYRPRPAPSAVDCHFFSGCSDVNQTLWIDLMTIRCACCMTRQRSPNSEIEVLQQQFSRGQYSCSFDLEIIAVDDYDSANNETVYTLDPHSYKITTRHNQSVSAGVSRKVQRSLSIEEDCQKRRETAKAPTISQLSPVKSKTKAGRVTIKRSSRSGPQKAGNTNKESSLSETEEALSLKPGVYYFSDKNSIVDFLKTKSIDDTVQKDADCEGFTQKRSDLPTLSKPVRFRVKSAPDPAPHLVRSGEQETYSRKQLDKNTATRAAPKRRYKRKFNELETDTKTEARNQSVAYCEDRTRKENNVSSSVPFYQDTQTVSLLPSQHFQDSYENYPNVPNSPSGGSNLRGQEESPEVQNENVDSTAASNAEEELDYSPSQGGKVTTHPSPTVDNTLDVNMQGTEHQNKDSEFLNKTGIQEDSCGYYSEDNDFGEIEEDFSNSNSDVKGENNLHSVRTTSKFFSPGRSKMHNSSVSTPKSSPKSTQRTSRGKTRRHSSGSESIASYCGQMSNVDLKEQTRKHSPIARLSPTQVGSRSSDLSLSPFGPDKCDIEMVPDEIVRTGLLSPEYGGIFSTPCVSPILDRKLDKKGNTQKIERLYNKCASLDTSTDVDKSLHMLATVATDLETLDETSSQSGSLSDKNNPCVSNAVILCEFNKEKTVGAKVTTRGDRFVFFLRQLLDNVEISRDSSSGKQVKVKFKETAKRHFPALWKESGQTRLKKLVKLLALTVPASPVEELAC